MNRLYNNVIATVRERTGGGRLQRASRRLQVAGTAFFARFLSQVVTFIVTMVAARYLAPAEYGVYTLAVVFATLITTFTYTGYFQYTVTRAGDDKEIRDTGFVMMVGIATVLSLIFIAAGPALGRWFGSPDLGRVVQYMVALQPLAAVVAWCSAILTRQNRMQVQYRIMIADNLFGIAIGVGLMVFLQSVWALVIYRYITQAFSTFLFVWLTKVRPGRSFRFSLCKDSTRYSVALYGSTGTAFFTRYGADLLLGTMFSTAEAGLYRFGTRLVTAALDVVVHPLAFFALAQFGEANRESKPMAPLLVRFSAAHYMLSGSIAIALIFFAEPIIKLLFQPEYLPALVVVYATSLRPLFASGIGIMGPVATSTGRTGVLFAFNAVVSAVVLLTVVVSSQFGMAVVAWTQTVVMIPITIAAYVTLHRVFQLDIFPTLRNLLGCAGFLALFAALTAGIRLVDHYYLGTGLTGLALSLCLAGAAFLFVLGLATFARVFDLRAFSG